MNIILSPWTCSSVSTWPVSKSACVSPALRSPTEQFLSFIAMLALSIHFSLITLQVVSILPGALAAKHRHFRHEALHARMRRQVGDDSDSIFAVPTDELDVSTSTSVSVLTYITPSPSATPVAITELSQVVTSYVPQMTLCVAEPYVYNSSPYMDTVMLDVPYRNLSLSLPDDSGESANEYAESALDSATQTTCHTMYSPTVTTVCATTLTGIVTLITVTDCMQDITFSSRVGYRIVTPTPSLPSSTFPRLITALEDNSLIPATTNIPVPPDASIETVATLYMAPWQSLTTPGYPAHVSVKICRALNGTAQECLRRLESWTLVPTTATSVSSTTVSLTTTVPGPAQLLVETLEVAVTRTREAVALDTVLVLSYAVETESLSKSVVASTRTRTVYYASTAAAEEGEEEYTEAGAEAPG